MGCRFDPDKAYLFSLKLEVFDFYQIYTSNLGLSADKLSTFTFLEYLTYNPVFQNQIDSQSAIKSVDQMG